MDIIEKESYPLDTGVAKIEHAKPEVVHLKRGITYLPGRARTGTGPSVVDEDQDVGHQATSGAMLQMVPPSNAGTWASVVQGPGPEECQADGRICGHFP